MTGRRNDEWSHPSPDAAIPLRVKARIFLRDGGRCQSCTRRVGPGGEPFAYDHALALVNGGAHAESNLQLLCRECHAGKSRTDLAEKSRAYRKRVRHIGVKPDRPGPLSKAYRDEKRAWVAAQQAKREEVT